MRLPQMRGPDVTAPATKVATQMQAVKTRRMLVLAAAWEEGCDAR